MRRKKLKKRAYEFKLCRVAEVGQSYPVNSPETAFDYWQTSIRTRDWFHEAKEHIVVLLLNTRYNVEGHNLVSIGSLSEALAHPREIFAPVLCASAFGFILMHNHPKRRPFQDRKLTQTIIRGANLLQVKLVDHVIAGDPKTDEGEPFFSFKEVGMID